MSEKDNKLLESMAEAVKVLPESQKNFLLGFAEGVAAANAAKKDDQEA